MTITCPSLIFLSPWLDLGLPEFREMLFPINAAYTIHNLNMIAELRIRFFLPERDPRLSGPKNGSYTKYQCMRFSLYLTSFLFLFPYFCSHHFEVIIGTSNNKSVNTRKKACKIIWIIIFLYIFHRSGPRANDRYIKK